MPYNWFRRKNLWIHTETQLKIMLYTVFSAAVLGGFMSWFMYTMLWKKLSENPNLFEEKKSLVEVFLSLPYGLLVFGLILLCILGVGLILSHKIAGPLYRFKLALLDIREGKLDTRVKLRPMDSLKDMEEAINQTTIALQKRDAQKTKIIESLNEIVSFLPEDLDDEIKLSSEQKIKIQEIRTSLANDTA